MCVLQVDLSLDELASPQRVVAAVQEGLAAASGRCGIIVFPSSLSDMRQYIIMV